MTMTYNIYEGRIKGEKETFLFFVSNVREVTFLEEIKNGERLLEIVRFVETVNDRNEAIQKTNWNEF